MRNEWTLHEASIWTPERADALLERAAQVLQEEIERRTGLRLPLTHEAAGPAVILIATRSDELPLRLPAAPDGEPGPEGYRLTVSASEDVHAAAVVGADARVAL